VWTKIEFICCGFCILMGIVMCLAPLLNKASVQVGTDLALRSGFAELVSHAACEAACVYNEEHWVSR
jgi:hypothetical protein